MSEAEALAWRALGETWCAACGGTMVGRVAVYRMGEGWTFVLDMLPGDPEPLIHGDTYLTPEGARAAAERQAMEWPGLVEGARRV